MTETRVLLFDGVCNLCNGIVQFTIKNDPKGKFKFASLQSDVGQSLLRKFGLPAADFDSFVYIRGNEYFLRSTAGLQVLKDLGGLWKLAYPFIFVPAAMRDLLYKGIAKTRYKIFGKRGQCMVPIPELKHRFLG